MQMTKNKTLYDIVEIDRDDVGMYLVKVHVVKDGESFFKTLRFDYNPSPQDVEDTIDNLN